MRSSKMTLTSKKTMISIDQESKDILKLLKDRNGFRSMGEVVAHLLSPWSELVDDPYKLK